VEQQTQAREAICSGEKVVPNEMEQALVRLRTGMVELAEWMIVILEQWTPC